jgi:folate-binding protein YgfZ
MSTTSPTDEAVRAVLDGAGLVDRSERGKLALSGDDRAEFLGGQVTNDVGALTAGTGCEAAFLTHKGRMLGEMRILETGDELLLDTDRASLQALFDLLRRGAIGYAVELHKRTVQRSLFALVGPAADDVLRAAGADLPDQAEHAHVAATVAGHPVRVVRTAFGADVLADAEAGDTEPVRAALVAAGAVPAPEEAADIVRVRAGRPRFDVDLDDATIPQEAGLNDRLVSFTKGCYVGQETVARLFYKGKPNRHLRGLALEAADAPGTPVHLPPAEDGAPGREIGRLGTVVEDPVAGPRALALLRREAEPGDVVLVGDGRATVVALPFT